MADATSIASGGAIPRSPLPRTLVAAFQNSSAGRARWQLINSFIPYFALWYAMFRAQAVSYWLMLPVAILAAGFLIRIFIIFHDCGHSSFFKSRTANNVTGAIAGLLNLTPYRHWRWQHALHHGSAGNLDQRGAGDIWTMTVQEFRDASRWTRVAYRIARNPLILFLVAPLAVFVVLQRFPSSSAPPRERRSVHRTNLAILLAALVMSALIGITLTLPCRVARSINCRGCCNGLPETLGIITSTISVRECLTTFCKSVTKQDRSFLRLGPSPFS